MTLFSAKFFNEGNGVPWILVPGWSMDDSLFELYDLSMNRILISSYDVLTFSEDLNKFLSQHQIKKVNCLGVSLGGYLVTEFVKQYSKLVNKCVLLGVKPSYDSSEIDMIRLMMNRSAKAYLSKFYKSCFVDTNAYSLFMRQCGDRYVSNINLDQCLSGLTYLSSVSWLLRDWPSDVFLRVLHGTHDLIAPFSDIQKEMKKDSRLYPLKDCGHLGLENIKILKDFVFN